MLCFIHLSCQVHPFLEIFLDIQHVNHLADTKGNMKSLLFTGVFHGQSALPNRHAQMTRFQV